MVSDVVGQLLPLAAAIALSPFPVIAICLMLGTDRARVLGPLFSLGWLVGLGAITALVVTLVDGADAGEKSPVMAWIRLALGIGLLMLAVKKWRTRPRPGEEVEPPKWMTGVDQVAPARAVVLGAALGGLNPKNLALTVAAGATIGQAGLDAGGDMVAAILFVILGSLTVVLPTLAAVIAPDATRRPLRSVKEFMSANSSVIMMIVLLIFGVKLVGDSLGAILS